ncbi:BLIP family protein [Streptomyces sp. NPDC006332]|uniref:BLIP family protein n=1 Tax=Streptomyces sp. NPDC006332 TaxID=3155456 RepID=UPI0033B5ABA9
MARVWRSVFALAVAGAAVLGTAVGAGAAEQFSFTAEKYSAVPFGTSRAEVREMLDVGLTKPGSAAGWCEEDADVHIFCFTESDDYAPSGSFTFNAEDKLIGKQQELLFTPKTPSMTLAKYNQVKLGMTDTQLWSIVSPDSCVQAGERYLSWPAATGHQLNYYCTATTGLFSPNGRFYLVDGKVTEKYQRALT